MGLNMDIKKYRKPILLLLAVVFLSLIGMVFLLILERIYNNRFDNIIFKGVKLGVIATSVLYLIHRNLKVQEV